MTQASGIAMESLITQLNECVKGLLINDDIADLYLDFAPNFTVTAKRVDTDSDTTFIAVPSGAPSARMTDKQVDILYSITQECQELIDSLISSE